MVDSSSRTLHAFLKESSRTIRAFAQVRGFTWPKAVLCWWFSTISSFRKRRTHYEHSRSEHLDAATLYQANSEEQVRLT